MNWITLIGIIIIAIGSALTFYGSTIGSKKDKDEIINKIEEFTNDLNELKNENIPKEEKEIKVAQIETDWNKWAKQFASNKEIRLLENEKNKIENRKTRIEYNNLWHGLYESYFRNLENIVYAYTALNPQDSIEFIKKPELPNNVFEPNPDGNICILKFSNDCYWFFWIRVPESMEEGDLSSIHLNYSSNADFKTYLWGDIGITFNPHENEVKLRIERKFRNIGLNDRYQFQNDVDIVAEILKKAFEYEVINRN